MIIKITDYYD